MNPSYYIEQWNRNVHHSISIDAQVEQILGYQFPKELNQQTKADLMDILQQVRQKMIFQNVLYVTKLDIHNSNADSQSVGNVEKLDTLEETVQTSHATNVTNMGIKHGNMTSLVRNANDMDIIEEHVKNSKKRKMNFKDLIIDTTPKGLHLNKKTD